MNYVRLLNLSEGIQAMVAGERLSMGHARCLLGVTDMARRQRLAEAIAENDLSVRALEEIVRRERTDAAEEEPDAQAARGQAHLRDLERRFAEAVGTKVSIHEGKRKATNRIIIQYFSLDDFERIAGRFGVKGE